MPDGDKLRILYVVPPTRTFAGIERVIDEICAELATARRDTLAVDVLYTSRYADHEPETRPYTTIQTEPKSRRGLMATVRRIAKAKPYDLIVVPQVEATVIFWVACLGLGRKFVCYLHGNPDVEARSTKARILFAMMSSVVVHRLAAVFAISPAQMKFFQRSFPSKTPHFWVPNPIREFANVRPKPLSADGTVTFVNVGRFSYQKGQDVLVRAFATVNRARPQTRLKIVGYGPEESQIVAQIAALGLTDSVVIEHHPHDPRPALEASDIYVSSSRWEGWSLAICEALRFGLPVVATNCDFGPGDILVDERLGQLVPNGDEDGLARAMVSACDSINAQKAHAAFRIAAMNRYSAANVVVEHANALIAAAQGNRKSRLTQA